MRFAPLKVIFLLIMLVSLVVRINKVDFPLSFGFAWGDGTRDYLVANHILKYGEKPIFGPYNLLFESGIYSSPLYFYLLSLMLLPFNYILTLSVINIFLQLTSIVLIYLIARKLFDTKTALIASVFFSFNPAVFQQSDYMWQPNLMQPVAFLGLYFLIQRHLVSFFLIALASAVHYCAFPWVFAFFLFCKKRKNYLWGLLIFIISFALFYSPILTLGFKGVDLKEEKMIINSFGNYFINLFSNIKEFFGTFKPYQSLLIFLSVTCLIYFFKSKGLAKQKRLTFLLLILFLAPIFAASFFNKLRPHYLTLSLGAFSILSAKIFTSLTSNLKVYFRVALFVLVLVFLTANFAFRKQFKSPFSNYRLIDNMTSDIKNELVSIQTKEGFADFSFFQIYSIAVTKTPFYYQTLDTILLVPLEDKLNQPLTKVLDSAYNHIQTGGKKYLLLACHKFIQSDPEACVKQFTGANQNHQIIKTIYQSNSLDIFLAKNTL